MCHTEPCSRSEYIFPTFIPLSFIMYKHIFLFENITITIIVIS